MVASTLFPGVALVTGAASGIGRATARLFAREGCRRLVLVDRNVSGLQETQSMLSFSHADVSTLITETDIRCLESVSAMVKASVERFKRIDYAVNAAGLMSIPSRSHETTLEEFDRINSVDYRGLWLVAREVIGQMRAQEPLETHDGRPGNRGSLVNVSSVLGQVARPNAAPYCGAKGAVISMTQADAIDYSKDNIRVNCVCPGVISTPMVLPNVGYYEPEIMMQTLQSSISRLGTADEVADCILFLSSSKASFVQGAAMVVDGGYTIR
ncbi:SDR family NAD(P)-dependent oxidoreductase [Aspergillus stella-maris]|uniref:SDR family NAD(P)-dependent oxidoreductase n=1 Tax=Aspergillus stella-maris TaxID=1810926 RepID=UPI003CCE3B3A